MQDTKIKKVSVKTKASKTPKLKKPPRVLLVEDDPICSSVLKYMLEASGCHCDAVTMGEEGLALFKKNKYQLVFMDHGLPGEIDGEETTRYIRLYEDKNQQERVPIVMVSAHLFYQDHAQMYAAGCTHILNKPLGSDQLGELLNYYNLSEK